ncbi:hypothetical protein LTS18_009757, partial [Coniosporium uncinatum]
SSTRKKIKNKNKKQRLEPPAIPASPAPKSLQARHPLIRNGDSNSHAASRFSKPSSTQTLKLTMNAPTLLISTRGSTDAKRKREKEKGRRELEKGEDGEVKDEEDEKVKMQEQKKRKKREETVDEKVSPSRPIQRLKINVH